MIFHENLRWSRTRSQGIASYLETHHVRKLQVGAGTHVLEGWFNTDIVPSPPDVFYLDSTRSFAFENSTFDYVFSEHHIEHLTYSEGLFTLRECYRVLKPGGKVRIATPSLEALLSLYTPAPNKIQQRYIRFATDMFLPDVGVYSAVFVINNAFHNWGHQFLYDTPTLRGAMREAGFVNVVPATSCESNDSHLRGIDRHGQFIGDEDINRFETMVLEGSRLV